MKKAKETSGLTPHVVVFVEGDTDEVFFNRLLNYYCCQSVAPVNSYEVQNMKGVGRYASSVDQGTVLICYNSLDDVSRLRLMYPAFLAEEGERSWARCPCHLSYVLVWA